MKKEGSKILFIMQEATIGTHMDYVYEMARSLKEDEQFPITLLLEKGRNENHPEWVIGQKYTLPPLRFIENICFILTARFAGTKKFYIHYSFISAISAGLITKIFGGTVYYWNCGMPWQYKRPWYVELYQKLAYKLIDVLVTGAESLRVPYTETYGLKSEQIKIIPNWIDLANLPKEASVLELRKKYGLKDNSKVVLFVHKLAKRKGAHWLMPIMQELKDANAQLLVVGDGPEEKQIKKDVTNLKLEDKIVLTGRLGREEVDRLYQLADVFLMPSEEEGSPHSLIEAMAYGVPCACFSVGGVPDTLPHNYKYQYKYGDMQGLADGMSTLISSDAESLRVKIELEAWVKNFDKTVAVHSFSKLLSE